MNDLLFAIRNIIIIELKLNYKIIFLITFLNFIIKKSSINKLLFFLFPLKYFLLY